MSPLELKEEQRESLEEYKALKKLLGGILLEQTESDPKTVAYYTRKFNEARSKK